MKQYKLTGAVAISAALALALGGCAAGAENNGNGNGEEPTETQAADYNPQPRENLQEGGTVNFGINEITPQMNPMNGDGSADTTRLASWYTPQFLLMETDGTPYKNDNYLDAWEFDEVDGKTTITFKINEKAHWNDGTDMTWKSIEQTWIANRSYDEGYSPNATDGYKEIESVEQGEDDKTAVVTFKGIFAWPQMLFTQILHPAVNTPEIFNEGFLETPHPEWGAGPYVIDEYDVNGQFASFKPNPEWWGDAPLLDEVTFTGLDADASMNAFKNGEIDVVGTATKDRLAQVADMEDVVTYRAQQTANTLLQVDADKPQFEDIDVRKAFFMAVNIEQQKEIAWNGLDYSEDPAGSFTLFSFQPGYSNALEEAGWKHDVDEANKLLDDAGWVLGDDEVREKDGVKLSVTYPIFSNDPTQEALAKSLQAQQKAVGIEVNIDVRPPADFSTDYTSKNWDIFGLRFTSSDPFGAAWFCQLYCSDSGLNLSATGSEAIDTRIHEEIETISDPEEQTAAAMELEAEIFAETWGIIPLYNGPSIVTAKAGLANLTPEPYVGQDLFGVLPVENVGWEK